MTPPAELIDDLLPLAERLARAAGALVEGMRAEFGTESLVAGATSKSSVADVVTAADAAAESLVVEGISQARPDDAILGEEGSDRPGSTGVRWIIDPIDGTTNYIYDLPAYTVSIAVEIGGDLVIGVVYEPKGDLLFAAAVGQGATRNGEPIRCSDKAELATALVATGFGYLDARRRGQAEVLLAILPEVRDIRRFGSAALDLCLLATGQVDAYYEKGLNHWDLAAGVVIASEAGARIEDLRSGSPSPTFLVGAAPGLFDDLTKLLRDQDADQKP